MVAELMVGMREKALLGVRGIAGGRECKRLGESQNSPEEFVLVVSCDRCLDHVDFSWDTVS